MPAKYEDGKLTFRGMVAPVMSAIMISGNGTGVRMKLDVDEEDVDVVRFIKKEFVERSFVVTFKLDRPVSVHPDVDVNDVTFTGSLPETQSAMTVSGSKSGVRIMLDVPDSHADAMPLIQVYFIGTKFDVTFDKLQESDVFPSAKR